MREHGNLALFVGALALAGCAAFQAAPPDGAEGANYGTGALLSVDFLTGTDVVGFHFEIQRVACYPGESFEPYHVKANVDLLDNTLPAGIDLLEMTLDPDSMHLGADLFMSLVPGCYDVLAAPASMIHGEMWEPSMDCAVARADDIEVLDGYTTEVVLISQCVGDEMGALDTVVVLNKPPVVKVEFPDGKFTSPCEELLVCAVAEDENDDPLEFVWEAPAEGLFYLKALQPEVIDFDAGHRVWRQCAKVVLDEPGTFDFEITVFDQAWKNGQLVRMETLVHPELSRDSLVFPIHSALSMDMFCVEEDGYVRRMGDGHLVRGCACPVTPEQYWCSGRYDVDPEIVEFACDHGKLDPWAVYPECVDEDC